ncbi:glycosyltransferase family 2 protein [Fangia hongkongensis]|uniref:glycosyltransferase family 2 protein n=1 Tax=Fangia hongkongensis TaxID=270495 RepID=UPI0003685922|nr:glycosyltransferase family 2 protein [Fangia hongkongensis]MBK2123633.1 glycosyltransferase family 2 protein [Fangia hongkongensis]
MNICRYSFIIPCMNEECVLPALFERLNGVLEKLDGESEVIFIDDGSRDKTADLIYQEMRKSSYIKLIRLSRNFGHQSAVTAGLDRAQGDAIIILDADLQDPPETIHDLIRSWRAGNDIVHAQRVKRQGETWFKKSSASLFYYFLSKLSSVNIPQNVGDFRLIDKKVLHALRKMPERDRFLRGMFSWVGFKQSIVQFERSSRYAGKTKYSFSKMLKLAISGVVGFSDIPLKLALWLGGLVSIGALSYGLYIVIMAQLSDIMVKGWASTIVILAFLNGISLLVNGVIGLYIGRIHTESKSRPLYLVSNEYNFDSNVKHMERYANETK